MSRLQELVMARRQALGEKGQPLSYREVARRSGDAFTHELVASIVSGRHKGGITDATARGLALALEVPVEEVYEAAGVPPPTSRFVLPERFDRLTHAQRQLLIDMGAALLEAYDKGRRESR
jgi:transcriptional regulator with XRE-family HTH domain